MADNPVLSINIDYHINDGFTLLINTWSNVSDVIKPNMNKNQKHMRNLTLR